MDVRAQLQPVAAALGLGVSAAAWERLAQLVELWQHYGRSMNLSADVSAEALARHIRDGLVTAACVRAGGAGQARWVDVGSGGGFPALVVAAVADARLTLVEPRSKRAAFLDLALRAIKHDSSRVIRASIDEATWDQNWFNSFFGSGEARFDVASARAVWAPSEWLARGSGLVHQAGFVVVHRADSGPIPPFGSPSHVSSSGESRVELWSLSRRAPPTT